MATKHGGPNEGAESSEAGSKEPVSGYGATMIGGPSLAGLVQATEEQFSVRGVDGAVEGPMPTDALIGAIRAGRFTGDESVSRDGRFWIPIVAIPDFGEAFRSSQVDAGSTLYGGAPLVLPSDAEGVSDEGPGTRSDDDLEALDAPTAGGTLAMELPDALRFGAGQQPTPGGATMHFDLDELPPEAPELADLLELDLTPEAKAVPATEQAFASESEADLALEALEQAPLSESLLLPAPKGFTAFSEAPPELLDEPAALKREPTVDLPLPQGFTHLGAVDPSVVEALGLEVEDLPRAVDKGADLPRSAAEALPRSAGGLSNLPTAAAALPRGGMTLLPVEEPVEEGESEFPANRGAAVGSIQTLDGLVGDFGERLDEPMAGGELPASARAAGASILDTFSSVDAIWAGTSDAKSAPDASLRGGAAKTVAAARPATSFGASTVPGAAHFDDFDTPESTQQQAGSSQYDAGFGGPNPSNEIDGFGSYQPSGGYGEAGSEAWGEQTEGEQQAGYDQYGEYFGEETSAQSTGARNAARPVGAKKPWLAILLGVAVVGGGGFYGFDIYQQKQAEEAARQAAIEAARNRVVEQPKIVLGQLSELQSGSAKAYQTFVDNGRKVLARGGSDEERARVMVAAALLLAEQPDQRDLFTELQKWNGQLKSADAPLTRLARGAYLALRRDETAKATLEGVSDPNLRAFASLFQAVAGLQAYRGIDLTVPLTPAKTGKGAAEKAKPASPAEGSAAAEGSGKAAAPTAVNAPPEGGAKQAEKPATAAAAAPVAAPEVAPLQELPKGTVEALERAASLDPKLVAPLYWLGWVALSEKDPAKAQVAFGKALALNPQHVRSVVGMADAQLREAKLVDAETRVTRAIEDLASTMTQSERSETYLLAASIAVARMQPPLAIENLLSALQADPRNRRATRELGEQFFRAGEFERAVEHFKQSAALSAGDPEATLGLIKAQFGKKDWVGLLKILPPAIAQYPRDGRFLYWFGRVQEEAVEFDKARAEYEKAVQADPNYLRPYIRLAELDFRSNDVPSARKRLDEALAVGSASSDIANEVGETFLKMGETNRAVTAFRAALAIDRSNPDARLNLAGHFIQTRQFSEALEELNEMIAAGVASPKVRLLQASAMIGVGEADKAIETLLKLLEADPKNASYLFELGRAHMKNSSWQSARENFASAYEQAPSMDEALYFVGRCELELGHMNEAISALTRVSQRNPSGEFHYWLGQAMERVQGDQALAEYTQAIEQDPAWALENPEVFFRRASIYQTRKQGGLAKLDLGVVLTLQPDHAPASWILGRVLYEERAFENAIARLDHAIAIDPKLSEAHFYAALSYLALPVPNNAKALGHLEAAVEGGLAEQTPRVLEKLAYARAQGGDVGGAVRALTQYVDKVPTLPKEQVRSYKNQIDRWQGSR